MYKVNLHQGGHFTLPAFMLVLRKSLASKEQGVCFGIALLPLMAHVLRGQALRITPPMV